MAHALDPTRRQSRSHWRHFLVLGSAVPVMMSLLTGLSIALSPAVAQAQTLQSNLFGWGLGTYGQLGDDSASSSSTPVNVQMPQGVEATDVAVGAHHSLAVGSNGQLYAWGLGTSGELGNGAKSSSEIPVTVHLPVSVSSSSDKPIAAGNNFSLAIGSDGHVYAWGGNADGQLGDGNTTSVDSPTAVSTLPSGFVAIEVAAGINFSLAMGTVNGQQVIYAWGLGTDGQLGNGQGTTSYSAVEAPLPGGLPAFKITAGDTFALVQGDDGTLWAWGNNASGELGNGTKTKALSPTQVDINVLAIAIDAGNNFAVAVGNNGLYSWGAATDGQLGNGATTGTVTTPTYVALPSQPTGALGAGAHSGYVAGANGTIYAWGLGTDGELGDGSDVSSDVPTPVTAPGFVPSAVASGPDASSAFAIGTEATATTLNASATQITAGQPVTLTATVTPTDGGGTVAFAANGSQNLCTSALSLVGAQYQAQCSTTELPKGSDGVTATYQGDGVYGASTSQTVNINVTGVVTATTLSASSSQAIAGQPGVFTATVAPTDGGGSVEFDANSSQGSQVLCTTGLSLVAGQYQAQCSTTGLPIGTYSISSTYRGDPIYDASTSSTLPFTVDGATVGAFFGGTLPTSSTGYAQQNFYTTVLDSPTGSASAYFFSHEWGLSTPAPVEFDSSASASSYASAPSVVVNPTISEDLLVAFVSAQSVANVAISSTASGQAPLTWTKVALPNSPTSLAVFWARDTYTPAFTTPVDVSISGVPQGTVAGLSVEALQNAGSVGAVAEASSAGGAGAGSPSVTVATTAAYPAMVIGVGYDSTSATSVTAGSGDQLDSNGTDAGNHATMWVSSQTSAVQGCDAPTCPVTLNASVLAQDAWQFAGIEVTQDQPGGYEGIQPNTCAFGPCGPYALFSFFGAGVANASPNCNMSADGGVGVSCAASIDNAAFQVGDEYEISVEAQSAGSGTNLNVWSAVASNVTTGAQWPIASFDLPSSLGVMNNGAGGFTEWFGGGKSNCASIPFAKVVNYITGSTQLGGATVNATLSSPYLSPFNCASTVQIVNNNGIDGGISTAVDTTGQPQINLEGTASVTSAASASSVTVAPYSPGDLLVASVATFNAAQVTVSGGGLQWTPVLNKADNVTGDGGRVAIWEASAPSSGPISPVTVTSSISGNGLWSQTLVVYALNDAVGAGATVFANGNGTTPSVTLTPNTTGSWIFSAGFDAGSETQVTPGPNQVLDGSYQDPVEDSQMWFQHQSTTSSGNKIGASQPVSISDTTNPGGVWDLGAVEVTPAPEVSLVQNAGPNVQYGSTDSVTINSSSEIDPGVQMGSLAGGDLLVAYVVTTNAATVSVSGGGLAWANVLNRADNLPGDGGLLSVWEAVLPQDESSIQVTSTATNNGAWAQTLYVQDFDGADGIGSVAFANGPSNQSPQVGLTPQLSGSWVGGLGFDAGSETTVSAGPNQRVDAQAQDTTENAQIWFQNLQPGTSSGSAVGLSDSLGTAGVWDLGAVEIIPES